MADWTRHVPGGCYEKDGQLERVILRELSGVRRTLLRVKFVGRENDRRRYSTICGRWE